MNRSLMKHWKLMHPYCPHQCAAIAEVSSLPTGLQAAVSLWEAEFKTEVEKHKKQVALAKESLFLTMYPSSQARFQAARKLLYGSETSRHGAVDDFQSRLIESAKIWKSKNSWTFLGTLEVWKRHSAMQFLRLFGSYTPDKIVPDRFLMPCADKWNVESSNSNLVFSNFKRTVRRPGSTSSYPASFADLPASRCCITVRLDVAVVGPNWLTFGLARRGMEHSGSDGVGLTHDSWGLNDERDSARDCLIASCGERLGRFRKFREGDIIHGVVDLDANHFDVTVNGTFIHRFDIPGGSVDDYCFAMTLANNHEVTIIEDPTDASYAVNEVDMATDRIVLNSDHTEMYFNTVKLATDLYKSHSSRFDNEFLETWSHKWETTVLKTLNRSRRLESAAAVSVDEGVDDILTK